MAWVGPLAALGALNACSNVQASEAYWRAGAKAEATADLLKDDAVASDPAKLEAAMLERVQLYTALAAVAPSEIRDEARTLQDAFARLYNALKAIGFDRTRANGDSGVAPCSTTPRSARSYVVAELRPKGVWHTGSVTFQTVLVTWLRAATDRHRRELRRLHQPATSTVWRR